VQIRRSCLRAGAGRSPALTGLITTDRDTVNMVPAITGQLIMAGHMPITADRTIGITTGAAIGDRKARSAAPGFFSRTRTEAREPLLVLDRRGGLFRGRGRQRCSYALLLGFGTGARRFGGGRRRTSAARLGLGGFVVVSRRRALQRRRAGRIGDRVLILCPQLPQREVRHQDYG
jgi:hypothetical protein